MGEWDAISTIAVALLLVVTAVAGGVPVGSVAGASSSGVDGARAIYVSGGTVHTVDTDGDVHDLGVNAEVVGRQQDLDSDGVLELPVVDGQGKLKLVESDGTATTLASGAMQNTVIATGDWDGDGTPAVYYSNKSANYHVYAAELGAAPKEVVAKKSKSVFGVADFNDDGDTDLVYAGGSQIISYYDGGTEHETGRQAADYDSGGTVTDLDGDGLPRVPIVTGSGYLALVDYQGNKEVLTKQYKAKKTHVGPVDWDGDGSMEVLSLDAVNSPAEVHVTDLDGTTSAVTDANGEKLSGDYSVGVAGSGGLGAPDISDYNVSNPSGRELHVEFNATEELADIRVDVDGPETFTLTEGDFTETNHTSGPYEYAATTSVATDGNYTATLAVAEDTEENDGADGQNGTVEIQTPYPTVTDVTLADAPNDDDEAVAGGDTLNVTATVTSESTLTSVTADAAAFGAGTVTLAHASGDTYEGQFTVDASNAGDDGATDITATATNEYDHSDTDTSGTVVLDTTAPTADAGPDVTIDEDTSVTLDGDGSSDDTALETYTWTFDDGTTESGVSVTKTYPDPGTYTPELTVTDEVGLSSTDTVTVTVENVTDGDVNLTVTDTSLTDATDDDGDVGGGDEVRVTATVDSEYAIQEVRADASAFGAGTVTLAHASGDQYETTFSVDAGDVSEDGETAVQVTAVDEYNHIATATTGEVFLDTTPPTAEAGSNVTVEAGTRVVFDGAGSSDNAEISRYVWTFEDGTTATGVTPARTYESPGTYTVELQVVDPVGHAATDTVTVDVTEATESTTTEVVYVESDDEDDGSDTETETNTTVTRNRTVTDGTDGTTVVRVRNVDANASVRFDVPAENTTAAGVRTVTVLTDHEGDARLWVTPNASAPGNATALDADRAVAPVGYWNLTTANAESATLEFGVNESRLADADTDAVSLYRLVDGAWERIDAQHVRTTDGEAQFVARVPDLSETGIFGVGVRRGSLDVTDLALSERETVTGRRVVLQATVANDGARTATETVALTVDGSVVANQTMTVPAESTRNATFSFAPDASGDYALGVGSEEVALSATEPASQLREAEGSTDEPAPEPDPERLPFGAIAALSTAAVGIAYELAMVGGLGSLLG